VFVEDLGAGWLGAGAGPGSGGEPWALDPGQVARCLGISRSRVYELFAEPDGLPSITIGRSRRVLVTDLRAWLESRRGY
jgi:excisionase family DNA binding protein